MPPGAPNHSFILPYRIRIDDFTTPRDQHFEPPALYLLSHTHSDHTMGLSARSFGARVVCSVDAKHMLLNSETAFDRIAFDKGEVSEKRRPYAHLKIGHIPGSSYKHKIFSRDLLRALHLNIPTEIELSDDVTVTLTLLDANHCPGAVMFLVEGPLGNFLHTGDFRADASFIELLSRNPWLQRYISPSPAFVETSNRSEDTPLRTLDAIHLDTACLFSHHDLVNKDEACSGLVRLITLFPPLTRFFINSWTWGYEDILKAIGRAFNSKIHVDRYKYEIYNGISDPFLKSLLTLDPLSTRFHACERKNRCDQVEQGTIGVVHVNPVTLSKVKWDNYFHNTCLSIRQGEQVSNLICPLARHSSLPELRAFVKLFKPKIVIPNSLNPDLGHLDWGCMPRIFGDCLADGGEAAMRASMRGGNLDLDCLDYVVPQSDTNSIEIGAEMDNLVGEGAEHLARQWIGEASRNTLSETSTERRLMTQMGKFLGPRGKQLLRIQLNTIALRQQQSPDNHDSQCQDEAEARGRAADFYFAPISPIDAPTFSTIRQAKNTSPCLFSHSTSLPLMVDHELSAPNHLTSPRKHPYHLWDHFSPSPSPVDSRSHSKMSTASPSLPLFNSLHSSNERAYHSLFDAFQFKKSSTTTAFNPLAELGHEPSLPHVNALAFDSANGALDSPCSTFSQPKAKEVSQLPIMPLVSPSVTSSPPQLTLGQTSIPKYQVLPTSVSYSNTTRGGRRGQLSDMASHPPMLDLKGLMRSSSGARLSRPATKRSIAPCDLRNSSSAKKPRVIPSRIFLEGLDVRSRQGEPSSDPISAHIPLRSTKPIPADPSGVLLPPVRSMVERKRRSKAKAIQVQIREKLVRALPAEQVSAICIAKIERRKQALTELRARKKTSIISRKQSVYGECEVSSHLPQSRSPCPPDPLEGQDTIDGFRQTQMVIFDGSGMDWDKSREYQEGFKTQRKQGIRYPQLPRPEKSFAESQSP